MAIVIVSKSKPQRWFSPKKYFKSKKPQNSPPHSPVPSTPTKSLTRTEEYQRVFSRFDTNGDGKISAEELRSYFASIGEAMSLEEARRAVSYFGDESLDLECFLKLMERPEEDDVGEKNDEDLKMAFEMFKEGDKGSACITPKGLQKMLSRLGESSSLQQCVSMIKAFDLDGNGVLDFHEFSHMMTST